MTIAEPEPAITKGANLVDYRISGGEVGGSTGSPPEESWGKVASPLIN
ncbi:MAG: hypothetical protein ABSA29_17280 [Terriglobales bacterium]|jgi:hypothetical protein